MLFLSSTLPILARLLDLSLTSINELIYTEPTFALSAALSLTTSLSLSFREVSIMLTYCWPTTLPSCSGNPFSRFSDSSAPSSCNWKNKKWNPLHCRSSIIPDTWGLWLQTSSTWFLCLWPVEGWWHGYSKAPNAVHRRTECWAQIVKGIPFSILVCPVGGTVWHICVIISFVLAWYSSCLHTLDDTQRILNVSSVSQF